MKPLFLSIFAVFLMSLAVHGSNQPNVIIILTDDQGWGDVGFNGCTDIPTPHLDSLARDGVIAQAGYASHPYCSPSRAGLITGRYQHRFGHEANPTYSQDNPDSGMPLDQMTIADVLKDNGYRTCAIGKWHLGDHPKFWPTNRGFDHWFGFSGGGMSFWGVPKKDNLLSGVLRNGEVVPHQELSYLTDDFSDETIRFIDKNKDRPFFIYLAYNAPHAPIQSTREYLEQVEHIEFGERAAYAAMVVGVDAGVGRIVEKLKAEGIYQNTLIFYYSDNGGHHLGASSAPFRGHKGMLFEGGIRVPFSITWPDGIQGGRRIEEPIIALDIFPTILSAAGIEQPEDLDLDGINLLPHLRSGQSRWDIGRNLYWRYSDGAGIAIRQGRFKMVYSAFKQDFFLFDLEKDPYEHTNLAITYPEKLEAMKQLHSDWNARLMHSLWSDPHEENIIKEETTRQSYINKAMAGEKNIDRNQH